MKTWREAFKERIGPGWTTWLRCLARGKKLPRWGNLRATTPFSTYFGFDRGTPVDRIYLHSFLEANRRRITGDVLEIQSTGYARRYGSDLRKVDSIDFNAKVNPTYTCDLAEADSILPAESYDCFLMPNTAQHLRRLEESLRQALRLVRPGGVILASAAGLLPLIPDTPADEFWRLTPAGWRDLAARVWPDCRVEVAGRGNCLTAVAAMLGLAAEELTDKELAAFDERYPVLVTIVCEKPTGAGQ